jgi:hypothetical protein
VETINGSISHINKSSNKLAFTSLFVYFLINEKDVFVNYHQNYLLIKSNK